MMTVRQENPPSILEPDRGSVLAEMHRIAAALEAVRLPSDTEARLQAAIGEALTAAGIEHARELVLGPSERYDHLNDRVDFAVERAGIEIGIEAKIGGARRSVWRQLESYARHDRLHGIILVGAVAMPDLRTIQRKPFRHVSIGRSWL